jgi:hypothetical protein
MSTFDVQLHKKFEAEKGKGTDTQTAKIIFKIAMTICICTLVNGS